ncbi:sensor histidine kinase [Rhizobium sp. BR 362]|uniref:sensor histidine kinase n=1 Tax=Rhizobium sp. BR 362 TaxID=3040670 RepID=UPI002F3FBC25
MANLDIGTDEPMSHPNLATTALQLMEIHVLMDTCRLCGSYGEISGGMRVASALNHAKLPSLPWCLSPVSGWMDLPGNLTFSRDENVNMWTTSWDAVSLTSAMLTTNAAKYGALSVPEGEIHVKWSLETGTKGRTYLNCEWREKNGPPVTVPARNGYGTELIEGTAAHLGGEAELVYDVGGLATTIKLPM